LKYFKSNGVKGGAAGAGAVVAFVENVGVFSSMESSAIREAQEKVVAVLVEVDYT
jgi:hypothetical protein